MPLIKGGTGKELRTDITKPSLDFLAASRQKRQKWFTRKRTRARAVSEEQWFVRSSSKMLASLSSLHFIPAAHHVSLFSAYSLTFAVLTSKMSEIVTRKRTRARAVSEEKRFVRPSKSQKSKQHYARFAVVIALYPGCDF